MLIQLSRISLFFQLGECVFHSALPQLAPAFAASHWQVIPSIDSTSLSATATSSESLIVRDANGQALAYLYFEDEPTRQMSMKRLSRDEAGRIAANIAKPPELLKRK